MSMPSESITDCDTKKFFNRANLYFTINVSIEWLGVPIVVSSANMSAQELVSERGRSFT